MTENQHTTGNWWEDRRLNQRKIAVTMEPLQETDAQTNTSEHLMSSSELNLNEGVGRG